MEDTVGEKAHNGPRIGKAKAALEVVSWTLHGDFGLIQPEIIVDAEGVVDYLTHASRLRTVDDVFHVALLDARRVYIPYNGHQ